MEEQRKTDIEACLRAGETVRFKPRGWSMYPLFVPGRDWAIVAPLLAAPKRGDVVVFRRDGGPLVIHRICRVRRAYQDRETAADDPANENVSEICYDLIGDNQIRVERGVRRDQLLGVLVGYVRKGREHSVDERHYRLLATLWRWLLPLRPLGYRIYGQIKGTH